MKLIKKRISFILVLFLLAIQLINVIASEPLKRNPTVISEFSIYEAGTRTVPQSLTPFLDYDITIKVKDDDGIMNPNGGLDELIICIWYGKNEDERALLNLNDEFFEKEKLYTPSDFLKLRWVRGGTAVLAGAGDMWVLNLDKSILPNKKNIKETTFEFKFNLRVGKVSREASFKNKWQLATKIADVDGNKDYKIYKGSLGFGIQMDYYGEIFMNSQNLDIENMIKNSKSYDLIWESKNINYICNSNYDEVVRADNTWFQINNKTNKLIRLYDAETKNTFAIKSNAINDIIAARLLPIEQSNLIISKNVKLPATNNFQEKSNFLYISINKEVEMPFNYEGKIYYGIVNSIN